jgi:PKD repeat protein
MRRFLTITVCLALLALLCTALPAAAAPTDYPFLRTFSNPGGTPWNFPMSYGIAVNSSGYVYVTDFGHPTTDGVRCFSPSGELYASSVLPSAAMGIAINSTGYLFVADYSGLKIDILTPTCSPVTSVFPPSASTPYGVAVNSSDYIFVTDPNRNKIYVLARDGTQVDSFATGSVVPWTIAVNSTDHIIVGQWNSPTLLVFDRDFQPASPTTIDTGFAGGSIWGLATDADNIIASNYWGSTFRVFSPVGEQIGTSSGLVMSSPSGIAVNHNTGEIFVIDYGHQKVQVFASPSPAPTPTPSGPSGSFAAYPESGTAPLTVQFMDYTANGRIWSWNFGDGGISDQQYPVHVYNQSGLYTVSVTVTDWSGNTGTKTEYHLIRVSEPATPVPTPVVEFTANATTGPAPMTVAFTDASSPAPSHRWWQFGDGASSTDANPVHTYERTGAYTVNLTVWTERGQATVSKPAYIVVDGDPRVPVANFTMSKTSGTAPLYVKFTDTSTGNPTSWRWDFGGLAWTKTRNPAVIFRQAGTYPVTLTVRNAYGWSSMGTNVTVAGAGIRTAKGDAVSVVG